MRLRLSCLSLLMVFCGLAAPATAQVCEHDMCLEGAPLSDIPGVCDPCVADICAADSYCCTSAWDNICVEMVATVCGLNVCIAACTHSLCEAGEPLDATCNSCAANVCQADPLCCSSQWDATCVGLVDTVCQNTRCEQGGSSCGEAIVLDYNDSQQLLMGTLEGMPPGGCASEGSSCGNSATWYSIAMPYGGDGPRYVYTCGSEYSFGLDSVLSIHTGCPGNTQNEVLVNDDWKFGPYPLACLGFMPPRLLDSSLELPYNIPGGATYKIRVSHYDKTPATPYQLHVPEPSYALLGGAGLATIFALSRCRLRRSGRIHPD